MAATRFQRDESFVCRHGSFYMTIARVHDKPMLLQSVDIRVVKNPAITTPDFLHMFMFHTFFSTTLTRNIIHVGPCLESRSRGLT